MPTIGDAHELARAARTAGDPARARFIYEQILGAVPEEAYALAGLAALAADAGRWSQAASYLERAIVTLRDEPAFHNQLGMVRRAQGRADEAARALRQAVALAPDSPELWKNLGVVLQEGGRLAESADVFKRAMALRPDDADAYFNLGNVLTATERDHDAVAAYQRAIALAPGLPEQHRALAAALARGGALDEALRALRRALELKPDDLDALDGLYDVLEKLGRRDEAQAALSRMAELAADAPLLRDEVVISQVSRGDVERAVARLQKALAINGNLAAGLRVLASALRRLDRAAEAEAAYRRAIEQAPDDAEALSELGVLLKEQGRVDEAARLFQAAARRLPDSAAVQHNQALMRLLLGELPAGFAQFESRLKIPGKFQAPALPRWAGEATAGRSLLVVAEQGLGDTIQFVRYAPLVKERSGARIVLQCELALHELLATAPGIDALVAGAPDDEKCDCYVLLLSLPHLLGTTLETIPNHVPYLAADPLLVEHWRGVRQAGGWRPEAGGGTANSSSPVSSLRPPASSLPVSIGIAWQGNPAYPSDARRSIPLRSFAPLARVPGVQLVSLQKGFGSEQLAELGGKLAEDAAEIIDLGASLDQNRGAFVDTAAVIAGLDLVITSDTAVAHLAGALGVRVWVALAHVPDWRWMLSGETSPWYPTMRLFRQTKPGDWAEVFERMAQALAQLANED